MKRIDAQLSELEAARQWREPGAALKVEKLLDSLRRQAFSDAGSLIRFHDALLFLRAFPHNAGVLRRADHMLAEIGAQVACLPDSGTSLDDFDNESVSGIAGTVLTDTYTYEVADWLAHRYPTQLRAEWDVEEQYRALGLGLPRFVPLLDDDAMVEADTPFLSWMKNAAGENREILWLIEQFRQLPISPAEKTELYDALHLRLAWDLKDSPASRTLSRRPVGRIFFHPDPLIRRNQVSLALEFQSRPLPVRKLDAGEAEEILNMCRDAVTVRYRELYGTTRGDPAQVYEAEPGRGVQIFLWGLPANRRLPLRAYHAGFTLKNGVPINYIEGISLFEWMEVGFNTFYAYRDGETAWIYSKALHFLHQLTGVACFSIYPYQLGHENEEAIQSGAFWFYRKLGFRPGRPDLQVIVEKEERKLAKNPQHRSSASTLRKLAADHAFYEIPGQAPGRWDCFSVRNLGLALQRHMAANFNGSAARFRAMARAALARLLGVNPASWSSAQQAALETFSLIAALIPEMANWSFEERQQLTEMIRAKASDNEANYLRQLQQHPRFRQEILRLGSNQGSPAG
jgi:hypothetical protein